MILQTDQRIHVIDLVPPGDMSGKTSPAVACAGRCHSRWGLVCVALGGSNAELATFRSHALARLAAQQPAHPTPTRGNGGQRFHRKRLRNSAGAGPITSASSRDVEAAGTAACSWSAGGGVEVGGREEAAGEFARLGDRERGMGSG